MLWLLLGSLPALPTLGGAYLTWLRPRRARRKHAACLSAITRLERELGIGEFDRVWAKDKTDLSVAPGAVWPVERPYSIQFNRRPVAAPATSACSSNYVQIAAHQYGLQQSAAMAAAKQQLEAALLFGGPALEQQPDHPRLDAPMFAATGVPIVH
jgi:hypothetical protein